MEYSVNTYCKTADKEREGCSFSSAFTKDTYYTDTNLSEPDEHMPGQAAYFRMNVDRTRSGPDMLEGGLSSGL